MFNTIVATHTSATTQAPKPTRIRFKLSKSVQCRRQIWSAFHSGRDICAVRCAEEIKCEAFVFDNEGRFCELLSGNLHNDSFAELKFECFVKIRVF